jgi:hypothetical protein
MAFAAVLHARPILGKLKRKKKKKSESSKNQEVTAYPRTDTVWKPGERGAAAAVPMAMATRGVAREFARSCSLEPWFARPAISCMDECKLVTIRCTFNPL